MGTYLPNISTILLTTVGSVYGLLSFVTLAFFFVHKKKQNDFTKELLTRAKSWFGLVTIVALIVLSPSVFGTIVLAYLTFMASRELFSIVNLRVQDRVAILVAYMIIPVQFYLAFTMEYNWFFKFIPMMSLTLFPIILMTSGYSRNLGRSLTHIPGVLMLTAYSLSHLVLFYSMDFPGFTIGAGGLILFLILITELNDVFQYNWGKAFGKTAILPKISPNKTWEGFIGGVLTTTLLAGALQFLTPLNLWQSLLTGFVLALFGFFGDALLSAIKRDLSVKDTDDLIPGHGGVMDRMDSLVFNAPVFFYIISFFTNQNF